MTLTLCGICCFAATSLMFAAFFRWLMMRWQLYLLSWKLPGPMALPILGNVCPKIQDVPRVLKRLEDESKKYPSPYRLWFGTKLVLVFTNPEQIKSLLTEIYLPAKPGLYYFWAKCIGTGLLTSHGGGTWRRNRLQMNAAFDNISINNYQAVVNKQTKKMAIKLAKLVGAETNKDISLNSMRLCFDIVSEALLKDENSRFQEDNMDPTIKLLHKLTVLGQRIASTCWKHNETIFKIFTDDHGLLLKAKVEFSYFISDIYKKRKAEFLEIKRLAGNEHKDKIVGKTPIDIMLQAQYTGNRPFDNEIMDEINNLYQAGVDPTASILSSFLMMLAIHGDVQERLYDEISSYYGGMKPDEVTIEDLPHFKYLDMCFNEVMRMFPGTAYLAREVTEDVHMDDGTYLPKDVKILIPSYMINMSPRFWENPGVFNPDRFSPENCESRSPYLFLPFGAGPRNCIGQQLGANIVKTAIIHILSTYTFHSDVALKDISVYVDLITVKPEKGYPMQIRARN